MVQLLLASGALERMGISLYYAAIALGGIFILSLSLLFGGHDADHDMDHDVDHDADHDGDHDHDHGDQGGTQNMNPFSVKVVLAFITGYGMGGFTGARFGLGWTGSSACGVLGGGAVAYGVYALLNALYTRQSNSAVRTDRLVGTTGTVVVTIGAGTIGSVALTLEDVGREAFTAKGSHEQAIALGTPVRVVATAGTMLIVEPVGQ